MADRSSISHVNLSGGGYEDPKDEKSLLVRGPCVIDGKEYAELFNLGWDVEYFVDKHEEREWLVV